MRLAAAWPPIEPPARERQDARPCRTSGTSHPRRWRTNSEGHRALVVRAAQFDGRDAGMVESLFRLYVVRTVDVYGKRQ